MTSFEERLAAERERRAAMTPEEHKREAQQAIDNAREIQRLKNEYGNPGWVVHYLGIENLSEEEQEVYFEDMLEGF